MSLVQLYYVSTSFVMCALNSLHATSSSDGPAQVRRWVEDAAATGVDAQVQRRLAEEAVVARGLLAAL